MKVNNWLKKDKFVEIVKTEKGVILRNKTGREGKVYSLKLIKLKNEYINAKFTADVISGAGALLTLVNRHKKRAMDVTINGEASSFYKLSGFAIPVIKIKPYSEILVKDVEISISQIKEVTFNKNLGKSSTIIITPLYPSPDNLYACGFVHTRVKAYKEAGIDVEVAVINSCTSSTSYEIDGIKVYKTNYDEMKDIIMAKSYNAILVHFLDSIYAKNLIKGYLNDTKVFIWSHGADILYKDYKEFYTPYFTNEFKLSNKLKEEYRKRDKYYKELSENKNFNWIFVSNWEKKRAEELLGYKFKNSIVIPNYIDEKAFKYVEKSEEDRKNIFFVRKFDNTKKYACDIAVLTILELSRRKIFDDLKFYICGEGEVFDTLIEPLRKFKNVIINNNFLTHKQLYEHHKKCGIGLFPTRQDTQGVSALEAASSGLVVLTSKLPVIDEFFKTSIDIKSEPEDYISYADKIEWLYNNPKEFKKLSKENSDYTHKICSLENTINKEIAYIKENRLDFRKVVNIPKKADAKALLTITIPSYNASKFLQKCLISILKSKYIAKLEVLIINDGSKDNTKEIGLEFEKLYSGLGRQIVKLVDKENGGHGSGINKGIELGTGKYFRVIDSDDWIDTESFDRYMEHLVDEDADEILTDYSEARTFEDEPVEKHTFKFMNEYIPYNANDICYGTYGFRGWGPSLPTATYKLEILRKTDFKLPEKTFYVDMLYNAYSIINVETIKKYDMDIYKYYIGNVGQSVSAAGMKRNHKNHERVILELMNLVTNDERISEQKKNYIIHLLLLPMVDTQYYIYLDLFHSRKKFMNFEKEIKKYPELLKYPEFNKRRVKFYRSTFGILVPLHPIIKRILDKFR